MVNELGPFTSFEIFEHTARFLELKDIGRLAQVCQQFNAWVDDPGI